MGQTRVRKTRKATGEVSEGHRNAKLPEIQKLKLEDNQNPTTSLAPPTSTVNSTSGSSLFSIPSAESLGPFTNPDTVYIEVKNTESKGQAIFATRKIQPGTLILSETPLIRLTQAQEDADKASTSLTTSTHQQHSTLEAAFTTLPRPLQKSYLKLFDSKKSSFTPVASIYYSNCYNLTTIPSTSTSPSFPGGSCIALTASRINHSCTPNVQFSYDEEHNAMLFHAIKPIARGKEILSTYDSVYEVRSQRQRKQLMYYGFKCDCEACEGKTEFWAKSDDRRRRIIEARREVKGCERAFEESGFVAGAYDPTHALEKWEGLLVKEGLVGVPLADLYKSMAKWAERKGDAKAARKWQRKELDVCRICFGERSQRVVLLRSKLEDIE